MALQRRLFTPTGDMETFRVPRHVAGTLKVWLRGGRGRRMQESHGGDGGWAAGIIDLAAGTTVRVVAGYGAAFGAYDSSTPPFYFWDPSDGEDPWAADGLGPNFGGQGGDGWSGYGFRGGGGCSSDIRVGGTAVGHRVAVAGGGGGSGRQDFDPGSHARGGNGGQGNNTSGQAGRTTGSPGIVSWTGRGGTLSAGGAGGTGGTGTGAPGGFGEGGNGGGASIYGGAGGGGGYYGGGGGAGNGSSANSDGAGGGGSSYFDTDLYLGDPGDPPSEIVGAVPSGYGYVLFEWEPLPGGIYRDGRVHLS